MPPPATQKALADAALKSPFDKNPISVSLLSPLRLILIAEPLYAVLNNLSEYAAAAFGYRS